MSKVTKKSLSKEEKQKINKRIRKKSNNYLVYVLAGLVLAIIIFSFINIQNQNKQIQGNEQDPTDKKYDNNNQFQEVKENKEIKKEVKEQKQEQKVQKKIEHETSFILKKSYKDDLKASDLKLNKNVEKLTVDIRSSTINEIIEDKEWQKVADQNKQYTQNLKEITILKENAQLSHQYYKKIYDLFVSNPEILEKIEWNIYYCIVGTEALQEMFLAINNAKNLKSLSIKVSSPYFDEDTAKSISQELIKSENLEELKLFLLDGAVNDNGVTHIAEVFEKYHNQYKSFTVDLSGCQLKDSISQLFSKIDEMPKLERLNLGLGRMGAQDNTVLDQLVQKLENINQLKELQIDLDYNNYDGKNIVSLSQLVTKHQNLQVLKFAIGQNTVSETQHLEILKNLQSLTQLTDFHFSLAQSSATQPVLLQLDETIQKYQNLQNLYLDFSASNYTNQELDIITDLIKKIQNKENKNITVILEENKEIKNVQSFLKEVSEFNKIHLNISYADIDDQQAEEIKPIITKIMKKQKHNFINANFCLTDKLSKSYEKKYKQFIKMNLLQVASK